MAILYICIAFLVGVIVAWLMTRSQYTTSVGQIVNADEKRIAELKNQYVELKNQYEDRLKDEEEQYTEQLAQIKEMSAQQIEEIKGHYTQQVAELKTQHAQQLAETKAQHAQQLDALKAQQQEQLQQQLALMREQMKNASERILKERAEELSTVNREQLAGILNPLQNHIQQMREAVEKSGRENSTTMERLDATIKQSIEQSREVGERADKLAQALTGENKTQGNFGELRLKQMLEEMGLEEGTQFEEQYVMRDQSGNVLYDDEEGRRMIPDVILHFPDQRDVIIDSKMSFTAFERYHHAQSDEERQMALHQHIASVRSHVNELSRKNYSKYIKEGRGKLDFVLMYVFSESALQLALTNDAILWKEAYDRGVIITGSQNLYVMLRVLAMTWRQVRQVENQQHIMECANNIIDRVQMFAERFETARQQLAKTQTAFDSLASITADSGTSIVTSARQLVKMGGKENPKRKKSLGEESVPMLSDNT